ncbi:hypothetical protein C8R45DRAFT_1100277 [Mycena sanguinolenta]|nr:hypothetical protein C8R45DRAFT_1100277 [Mycena sanguinolenta]
MPPFELSLLSIALRKSSLSWLYRDLAAALFIAGTFHFRNDWEVLIDELQFSAAQFHRDHHNRGSTSLSAIVMFGQKLIGIFIDSLRQKLGDLLLNRANMGLGPY